MRETKTGGWPERDETAAAYGRGTVDGCGLMAGYWMPGTATRGRTGLQRRHRDRAGRLQEHKQRHEHEHDIEQGQGQAQRQNSRGGCLAFSLKTHTHTHTNLYPLSVSEPVSTQTQRQRTKHSTRKRLDSRTTGLRDTERHSLADTSSGRRREKSREKNDDHRKHTRRHRQGDGFGSRLRGSFQDGPHLQQRLFL